MSDNTVKFQVSLGPRHSNSSLYEYATDSRREGVVCVYGLSVWMIHNHKGENASCRYNEYMCAGRTSQWTPVCTCTVTSWCQFSYKMGHRIRNYTWEGNRTECVHMLQFGLQCTFSNTSIIEASPLVEIFVLLRRDAAYVCSCLPMLRDSLSVLHSRASEQPSGSIFPQI